MLLCLLRTALGPAGGGDCHCVGPRRGRLRVDWFVVVTVPLAGVVGAAAIARRPVVERGVMGDVVCDAVRGVADRGAAIVRIGTHVVRGMIVLLAMHLLVSVSASVRVVMPVRVIVIMSVIVIVIVVVVVVVIVVVIVVVVVVVGVIVVVVVGVA